MKKFCDFFTDPARLGLLLAFASAAALAFAYTMQYGFNHLPCHLCYEQRKPYMLAIAFGVLAFAAAKTKTRLAFPFLLLAGVCFLVDMGIAGFHFGTEQKWWPLAAGCGGEGAIPDPDLSMAELMKYFENRPIVRCDVPGWVFLGISMTGWNFLYASVLALFTFFHAIRGRNYGKKA
jgi:disulfide bond formation protein DsbB